MQGRRATRFAVTNCHIYNHKLADATDAIRRVQLRSKRPRNGWACEKKIDISAAGPVMAGCLRLLDVAVLPGPADLPLIHFAQSIGAIFAQQCGERFVAETASGCECIGQVVFPMVWRLLPERGRDRHLRHDSSAAPPD